MKVWKFGSIGRYYFVDIVEDGNHYLANFSKGKVVIEDGELKIKLKAKLVATRKYIVANISDRMAGFVDSPRTKPTKVTGKPEVRDITITVDDLLDFDSYKVSHAIGYYLAVDDIKVPEELKIANNLVLKNGLIRRNDKIAGLVFDSSLVLFNRNLAPNTRVLETVICKTLGRKKTIGAISVYATKAFEKAQDIRPLKVITRKAVTSVLVSDFLVKADNLLFTSSFIIGDPEEELLTSEMFLNNEFFLFPVALKVEDYCTKVTGRALIIRSPWRNIRFAEVETGNFANGYSRQNIQFLPIEVKNLKIVRANEQLIEVKCMFKPTTGTDMSFVDIIEKYWR